MKLGYLGPPGTFSHQAAQRWLHRQFDTLVDYSNVMETLMAVVKGQVDAAVVPVENSIEGSVTLTMDLLAQEQLNILGETVLDINHCLVSKEKKEPLAVIVSHPQALAQCRGYLQKYYPHARLEQAESTAHAAQLVAARPRGWGAISSRYAAEYNNLVVREEGLADFAYNQTRFLLVGRGKVAPTGNDKTSLVFSLPQDKPGGLHAILWEFARENINLTRIESRPSKKELGQYIFFIDCEGHQDTAPLKQVLEILKEKTSLLRVLGSYSVCGNGGS